MFNKKKLQKEFLTYQSEVQASLNVLQGKLAEVRAIADAGERYAALIQFEGDVSSTEDRLANAFTNKASDLDDQLSKLKGWLSIGGTTALLSGAAFLPFMAPVLAGVMIVGGAVSFFTGMTVAGGMMDNSVLYDLADEKIESAQPFASLFADIQRSKEAVLDKELGGVASSSRFNELYRLREVKLAFKAAAVRERMRDENRVNKPDGEKLNP